MQTISDTAAPMELSPVHVRTFAEVVRHASFSRAAETLHVSQPAVSHHIRHLESALGARLLERVGRRACPTAAGGTIRSVVAAGVRRGGGRRGVAMELGNVEATKRLVAAGLGVSVISAVAVRGEVRARTLTARPLAPPLARRLAIVRRRDKPPTPALDAVLAALDGVAGA